MQYWHSMLAVRDHRLLGVYCGRFCFRDLFQKRTMPMMDSTESHPCQPSLHRTVMVSWSKQKGWCSLISSIYWNFYSLQGFMIWWETRGNGPPQNSHEHSRCTFCAAPPGSTPWMVQPITEPESQPGELHKSESLTGAEGEAEDWC